MRKEPKLPVIVENRSLDTGKTRIGLQFDDRDHYEEWLAYIRGTALDNGKATGREEALLEMQKTFRTIFLGEKP
jgi:hypothetical protein